jgi:hypothetical protein
MSSINKIQLVNASIINQGAFSDIFKLNSENFVYKLFISQYHPKVEFDKEREKVEDQFRRLVFESEKKAYEIATVSQELSQYIPKYFGNVIIDKVWDLNENDISKCYLLDCCYKIEFIHGQKEDINPNIPHVERIISLFHSNGIGYTEDSAAFYQDDESKIKLIDFATEKSYYQNEYKWLTTGKF